MVAFVKREECVMTGNFECPGCRLVMENLEDGTMKCGNPRCERRSVRYERPTMFLKVVVTEEKDAGHGQT